MFHMASLTMDGILQPELESLSLENTTYETHTQKQYYEGLEMEIYLVL